VKQLFQRYSDIYSGVFLFLIGLGMYLTTFSFKVLTASKIGSAFMPQLIAISICVISIFIIVTGFKKSKLSKVEEVDQDLEAEKDDLPNYLPVFLSVVLMVVYLYLMSLVGFLIMTALYLVLQMYVLSDRAKKKIPMFIIIAIISSGSIYYVFRTIFHVMLPSGLLG